MGDPVCGQRIPALICSMETIPFSLNAVSHCRRISFISSGVLLPSAGNTASNWRNSSLKISAVFAARRFTACSSCSSGSPAATRWKFSRSKLCMLSAIDFIRAPQIQSVLFRSTLASRQPESRRTALHGQLVPLLAQRIRAQDVAMPERVFAGPVVHGADITVAAVVDLTHQSNRV